jgi:hypothetical protein
MGKMKSLVTDLEFTLTAKGTTTVMAGRKTKEEETYTYFCAERGIKLAFHAHPTRAFNWVLIPQETDPMGASMASLVINAFVKAAMDRGDKSFDDAIKTLVL